MSPPLAPSNRDELTHLFFLILSAGLSPAAHRPCHSERKLLRRRISTDTPASGAGRHALTRAGSFASLRMTQKKS